MRVCVCMCVFEGAASENKPLNQKAEASPEMPTEVKRKEETEGNKKRTPWKETKRSDVQ